MYLVLTLIFLTVVMSVSAAALSTSTLFLPMVGYHMVMLPTPPMTYTPPVVTPTPTKTPPGSISPNVVRILTPQATYTSLLGRHIVGEVKNLASFPVAVTGIRAQFYDANNHLLGHVDGAPLLSRIEPNKKACFNILVPSTVDQWSRYELSVTDVVGPLSPRPRLSVYNLQPGISPYNTYMITGKVRNDEGVTLWTVTAAGALYDEQGHIWDCSLPTGTVIESLAPGETWDIMIIFPRPGVAPATYKVEADGYRAPMLPGY